MRLYTIGHSTHSVEHFLQMLRSYSITSVCDVRSAPYSKHTPQFNCEPLERSLQVAGFRYIYLGDQLGGRSKNPGHYSGGHVQYAAIAASPSFREGLDRLKEEMTQNSVVLMCVEKDPMNCHRALLVTRQLRASGAEILHIRHDGTIEANHEFERRLRLCWKLPVKDLFGDNERLIAWAYDLQSKKIAYSTGSQAFSEEGPDI